MSDERLYLVNKETKKYLLIAKGDYFKLNLGNVELFKQFLHEEPSAIIMGRESDDKFWNRYIANKKYSKYNEEAGWIEYPYKTNRVDFENPTGDAKVLMQFLQLVDQQNEK